MAVKCDKFQYSSTAFEAPNTQPDHPIPLTSGCTEVHRCDIIATLLPRGAAPLFYQPSDHLHTSKLAGNVQNSGSLESPVLG